MNNACQGVFVMQDNYVQQIHTFLLSYQEPTPWDKLSAIGVDVIDIEFGKNDFGAVLVPTGILPETLVNRTVTGRETYRKRVNYGVVMRLRTETNDLRKDVAIFLPLFIQWINKMDKVRNKPTHPYYNPTVPKFSDTSFEKMTASGGERTAILESTPGTPVGEFIVRLAFDFDIVYS